MPHFVLLSSLPQLSLGIIYHLFFNHPRNDRIAVFSIFIVFPFGCTFLLKLISNFPLLYVDLAVSVSVSDGILIVLWYFLRGSSLLTYRIVVSIYFNFVFTYSRHFYYNFNFFICCSYVYKRFCLTTNFGSTESTKSKSWRFYVSEFSYYWFTVRSNGINRTLHYRLRNSMLILQR